MLLVDGREPEEIAKILEIEIHNIANSEMNAARVYEAMGGYSPTIGIIGAVLGLIHVMNNLADPSAQGCHYPWHIDLQDLEKDFVGHPLQLRLRSHHRLVRVSLEPVHEVLSDCPREAGRIPIDSFPLVDLVKDLSPQSIHLDEVLRECPWIGHRSFQ